MVTPVDVAAVLTPYACVPTTLRVTPVIAVSLLSTTSHGDTEKRTMLIPARCVTATVMPAPVTTTPHWIRSPTATIREEGECVTTARAIQLVSTVRAVPLATIGKLESVQMLLIHARHVTVTLKEMLTMETV
jgi:hypothetical protein